MIDILLLIVLLGYLFSGYRQGLVVGVLSLGGFLGGAMISMWVVPMFTASMDQGPKRSMIVLAAVLGLAWFGQVAGSVAGLRLREGLLRTPGALMDQILGAVAGVLAVSLVMWFVGGALRSSSSPAIARTVAGSTVLRTLDAIMPNSLVSFAGAFRQVIAGSAFPRVFDGLEPDPIASVEPPDARLLADRALFQRVGKSLVKVTGSARCNQDQEGSGSVIAPHRVLTNAHVVAGVSRPYVQVGGVGKKYAARVVIFDPRRDLAVLSVPTLKAPPLVRGLEMGRSDDAIVVGFPNNGPYQASAGRIRSVIRATGNDIYGGPGVEREVYSLYARVQEGNSGGPLIDRGGRLIGVVFAKSTDDPATGYALTLNEAMPVIQRASAATAPVSSQGCSSG